MTYLNTGIDALDSMLAGDSLKRKTGPLHPGDVVLIRGEPGSGKTTLAFQIASNVLSANLLSLAQFVTIEESPRSLREKHRAFGFWRWAEASEGDDSRVRWFDRARVKQWIDDYQRRQDRRAERLAKKAGPVSKAVALLLGNPVVSAAQPFVEPIVNMLLSLSMRRFALDAPKTPKALPPAEQISIVVIDSLNALLNLLIPPESKVPARVIFTQFCQALRQGLASARHAPIIVMTGEYHFGSGDVDHYLPESFFCDTEIVLRTEPVRVPRQHLASDKFALGYDVAAMLTHTAKSAESRSFCRVLKARHSPNQARRCCYDIETGIGVRFFETYPGDGKLLLFAENERQRQAWHSFLRRDLTDAYPALRFELFTMAGLQSVYESTRRLHRVPLRTDMTLCTLDSYWVVGYRDYRLKVLINARLQKRMERLRYKITGAAVIDKYTLQPLLPEGATESPPRGESDRTLWRVEYPRLVNDLVQYALLVLEKTLRAATLGQLLSVGDGVPREEERIADLERSIKLVQTSVESLKVELVAAYDFVSWAIFGEGIIQVASAVCDDLTLLDTFLRPLPRSRIALLGQYDGDLLAPLVREDMHEFRNGEDHWLCVPYDANIGVFVARLDLLANIDPDDLIVRQEFERNHDELAVAEARLWRRLGKRLAERKLDGLLASCVDLTELARQLDSARNPARTRAAWKKVLDVPASRLSWAQVISLSAATGYEIGIEACDYDTLVAFFLELVWNSGGGLEVNARYQVRDKPTQLIALVRALQYFGAIFQRTNTPLNQTVDPSKHAGRSEPYGNWIFARLWYSTLVDAITARRSRAEAARDQASAFVCWADSAAIRKPHLEILEMPKGLPDADAPHYTCWGDWNLALLAGSENVELACDLVSNLMGALKVTERGLRGAALPTVKEFYTRYSNQRCVPQDVRSDVETPRMTFGELRRTYLDPEATVAGKSGRRGGVFRQAIYDYRHCAREIYSVLLDIKERARDDDSDRYEELLLDGACRILTRIEKLRDRYIFIGDSFRHDVVQTAEQFNGRERRRWPRLAAAPGATASVAGKDVVLRDISPGGCCVETGASDVRAVTISGTEFMVTPCLRVGDAATKSLGVEFERPLMNAEFQRIVRALA